MNAINKITRFLNKINEPVFYAFKKIILIYIAAAFLIVLLMASPWFAVIVAIGIAIRNVKKENTY